MSAEHRDASARATAAAIIRYYSTSFSWAVRLLDQGNRDRIRGVYALARTADEIVDTPGRDAEEARAELQEFSDQTFTALRTGHSANPVIQAFVTAARTANIDAALVESFFASMRTDLDTHEHDAESVDRYIYGSAEVIGLMCLRSFLVGTQLDFGELAPGAQSLGAAFQKVNFLRDLAADQNQLGRRYLPQFTGEQITELQRDAVIADIDADLATAALAIERLPQRPKIAVRAAHALFAELNQRLARTPAAQLMRTRVRVPDATKARLLATSFVRPATKVPRVRRTLRNHS